MAQKSFEEQEATNEPEQNEFIDIKWEEEPELNQEINSSNGFSKPIFDTNTNAVVSEVVLRMGEQIRLDSKDKQYHDLILQVTSVTSKGQETTDNYGGLRKYVDDGHFWAGDKSAFGKLKKKMQSEFGIKTWKEIPEKLKDSKVKLKSETNPYKGETYTKNVIQGFR